MMDSKRQGEIDRKLIKHILHKNGVRFAQPVEMRDKIACIAEAIGISPEEFKEYAKSLAQELINECFSTGATDTEKPDGDDKPKPGVPLGKAFAVPEQSA